MPRVVPPEILTIPARLDQRKRELNLSDRDLADRLGTHVRVVRDLCKGISNNPTASTILRLCHVLRCSPNWLLTGRE